MHAFRRLIAGRRNAALPPPQSAPPDAALPTPQSAPTVADLLHPSQFAPPDTAPVPLDAFYQQLAKCVTDEDFRSLPGSRVPIPRPFGIRVGQVIDAGDYIWVGTFGDQRRHNIPPDYSSGAGLFGFVLERTYTGSYVPYMYRAGEDDGSLPLRTKVTSTRDRGVISNGYFADAVRTLYNAKFKVAGLSSTCIEPLLAEMFGPEPKRELQLECLSTWYMTVKDLDSFGAVGQVHKNGGTYFRVQTPILSTADHGWPHYSNSIPEHDTYIASDSSGRLTLKEGPENLEKCGWNWNSAMACSKSSHPPPPYHIHVVLYLNDAYQLLQHIRDDQYAQDTVRYQVDPTVFISLQTPVLHDEIESAINARGGTIYFKGSHFYGGGLSLLPQRVQLQARASDVTRTGHSTHDNKATATLNRFIITEYDGGIRGTTFNFRCLKTTVTEQEQNRFRAVDGVKNRSVVKIDVLQRCRILALLVIVTVALGGYATSRTLQSDDNTHTVISDVIALSTLTFLTYNELRGGGGRLTFTDSLRGHVDTRKTWAKKKLPQVETVVKMGKNRNVLPFAGNGLGSVSAEVNFTGSHEYSGGLAMRKAREANLYLCEGNFCVDMDTLRVADTQRFGEEAHCFSWRDLEEGDVFRISTNSSCRFVV